MLKTAPISASVVDGIAFFNVLHLVKMAPLGAGIGLVYGDVGLSLRYKCTALRLRALDWTGYVVSKSRWMHIALAC